MKRNLFNRRGQKSIEKSNKKILTQEELEKIHRLHIELAMNNPMWHVTELNDYIIDGLLMSGFWDGARFNNIIIRNTKIAFANFFSSEFQNVTLDNVKIYCSKFSGAVFFNTKFSNSEIIGTSFTPVFCNNVEFKSMSIKADALKKILQKHRGIVFIDG